MRALTSLMMLSLASAAAAGLTFAPATAPTIAAPIGALRPPSAPPRRAAPLAVPGAAPLASATPAPVTSRAPRFRLARVLGVPFLRHINGVPEQIDVSPDGALAVSRSYEYLHVFDLARDRCVGTLKAKTRWREDGTGGVVESFRFARFDRRGRLIVGNDFLLRVMDVADGQPREQFAVELPEGEKTAFALSPDENEIAVGGPLSIAIVDLGARTVARTLPIPIAPTAISWSPDARAIEWGAADESVRSIDATTGAELARTEDGGPYPWPWPAFLAAAKGSLVFAESTTIRVFDGVPLRGIRACALDKTVLAFAASDATLAVGRDDGVVALIDPATMRETRRIAASRYRITALALSRDGDALVSGDGAGALRRWDLTDPREIDAGHSGGANDLAFSPDGRSLASASSWSEVLLWDLATDRERARLAKDDQRLILLRKVAFSPDGALLTSSGNGNVEARLDRWDATNGAALAPVTSPRLPEKVYDCGLAFTPDHRLAATGSNGTFVVFDVASGREVDRFVGESEPYGQNLALASDGKTLAFERDRRVVIARAGETIRIITPPNGRYVQSLAFSPDGRSLAFHAFASADGESVELHDVATGARLASIENGRDVAFSRDGLVAVAITDWKSGASEIVLLSDRGARAGTLRGIASWTTALAFSPDGALLAQGRGDGTIALWERE